MPAITPPPSFWEEEGRRLAAILVPRLTQMALEGARIGSEKIGIGFNWTLYNILAERWAKDYTDILLKEVKTTNKAVVGDILSKWIATQGGTVGDLYAALAPWFGIKRATTIGITEATRAFASGELLAYQANGIEEIKWGTNKDELVCPLCGGVNGQVRKIGEPFGEFVWRKGTKPEPVFAPPYHPNCRCGISPVLNALRRLAKFSPLPYSLMVSNVLAMLPPIDLLKGDFEGHPFRGNQWTEGKYTSGYRKGGQGTHWVEDFKNNPEQYAKEFLDYEKSSDGHVADKQEYAVDLFKSADSDYSPDDESSLVGTMKIVKGEEEGSVEAFYSGGLLSAEEGVMLDCEGLNPYYLAYIAVAPKNIGVNPGWGERAMYEAVSDARSIGADTLELDAFEDWSQNFYKRIGMKQKSAVRFYFDKSGMEKYMRTHR